MLFSTAINANSGCPELIVTHGSVSYTHTGFGATVRVTCDDCYYRSNGDDIAVCEENGQWSAYPQCRSKYVKWTPVIHHHIRLPFTGITCPKLLPPRNGRLIQQGVLGNNCNDIVFFDCNPGYQLEGQRSVTCLPTGRWSNLVPICKSLSLLTSWSVFDHAVNDKHINFSCTDLVIKCPQPPSPVGDSYICSPELLDSSVHTILPSFPTVSPFLEV